MDEELHFQILKCFHLFKHCINPETSKIDILPGQHKVLQCLNAYGSLTPKDIGDYCKIDKSTTTSLINKMLKMGYIQKESSLNDKRSFVLHLTDLGNEKAKESLSICHEVNNKALSQLNDEERKTLFKLLNKVNESLEDEIHE